MALKAFSRRALRGLTLLLVLATLWDGFGLLRARRINSAVEGMDAAALARGDAPEIALARAFRAAQQGDTRSALSDYRLAAAAGSSALRQTALYNSANLYLRQALELDADVAANQRLPLLELAKQNYREVLRLNSAHWDTRYNLERALRLAPEAAEADPETLLPPPPRERAMTTMKGFTLGLP